jgi:hypothetical protein
MALCHQTDHWPNALLLLGWPKFNTERTEDSNSSFEITSLSWQTRVSSGTSWQRAGWEQNSCCTWFERSKQIVSESNVDLFHTALLCNLMTGLLCLGFGTTNCMEDSFLDWICWSSFCLCLDLYKTLALLWWWSSQPTNKPSYPVKFPKLSLLIIVLLIPFLLWQYCSHLLGVSL